MTINEFIEILETLRDRLDGDEQLCVRCGGAIGSSAFPIDGVAIGFDWDKGKLVLEPKHRMVLAPKAKEQAKTSNLKGRGFLPAIR